MDNYLVLIQVYLLICIEQVILLEVINHTYIYYTRHKKYTDILRFFTNVVSEPPVSQSNQFAWHPSGEIHMSVGGQGSVTVNTHKQETEDVEVMSTDSSSSSSSDSQ